VGQASKVLIKPEGDVFDVNPNHFSQQTRLGTFVGSFPGLGDIVNSTAPNFDLYMADEEAFKALDPTLMLDSPTEGYHLGLTNYGVYFFTRAIQRIEGPAE